MRSGRAAASMTPEIEKRFPSRAMAADDRAAKRALPAHEGHGLEQVGLALRVLSRDQSDTPAKEDGVGGEIAEALVREFGELQAVLSHLERFRDASA